MNLLNMTLRSKEFWTFAFVWLVFWLCAYRGYAQDYFVEDNGVTANSTAGTFNTTIGASNADLLGDMMENFPVHRSVIRFRGKEYPIYHATTPVNVGSGIGMKGCIVGPELIGGILRGAGQGMVLKTPGTSNLEGSFTRLVYASDTNPTDPTALLALQGQGQQIEDMSFHGERISISGDEGTVKNNLVGLGVYHSDTADEVEAGWCIGRNLSFGFMGVGVQLGEPTTLGDTTGEFESNTQWHDLYFENMNTCVQVNADESVGHTFTGGIWGINCRRGVEINRGGRVFINHINITRPLDVGAGLGDGTATLLYIGRLVDGNAQVVLNGGNFDDTVGSNGIVVDCEDHEGAGTIVVSNMNVSLNGAYAANKFQYRVYGAKHLILYHCRNISPNTIRCYKKTVAMVDYKPRVTLIGCQFTGAVTTLANVFDDANADDYASGDYYARCLGCVFSSVGSTIVDQANYDADGDGDLP